jgi:hypothetical protein
VVLEQLRANWDLNKERGKLPESLEKCQNDSQTVVDLLHDFGRQLSDFLAGKSSLID